MANDAVQCPICLKEFSPECIEAHASKCLFLNEKMTEPQGFSKTSRLNERPRKKNAGPVRKAIPIKGIQGDPIVHNVSKPTSDANKEVETDDARQLNNESRSSFNHTKSYTMDTAPLAERMRPNSVHQYVGQSHIIGNQSMFLRLVSKGQIPNTILWGPPGCGKTSLANVIATICRNNAKEQIRYVKVSAALAGIADVKGAMTVATNELKFGRRTVMFMDEIHRFNKSQQDILLPHIEAGTITLIGATTENPSYSLNAALLSRCRVMVLEKLTLDNIEQILVRAVASLNGIVHRKDLKVERDEIPKSPKFIIDENTIKFLGETCDGDARIALAGLELAVQSIVPDRKATEHQHDLVIISVEDIRENLKKTHMLYDRRGDQHYDIISALHKSVRASDENASLYWLTRMISGGEDPVYIARRMVRMACEDIGLEDPKAMRIAVHTMHACKMIGVAECDVLLAQCAIYLARAPKSRLMEDALRAAQRFVAEHEGAQYSVPVHLRNLPTEVMAKLDFEADHNMTRKDFTGVNYFPEEIKDVDFFGGQNLSNS